MLHQSAAFDSADMSGDKNDGSVATLVLRDGEHVPSDNHDHVIIRLSPQEESLISTINNAVEYLEHGRIPGYAPQSVEVRIAGGWVRDKLLGLSTYDVDLAIDLLSGVDFATVLQSYLKLTMPNEVHKLGVIAANPAQSKHLETATMVVMGLECDFCNLRAEEVYTHDSRIPMTRFGTPLEDAQRRDFCMNSLFFNLKTFKVEDWTGRGLSDLLEKKILVTPLDPLTTFQDDPLRVLRAIRFAIRFDYRLDDKLQEAISSKIIHQALAVKVSRERVGKELEGMLSGKGARPHDAFSLIGTLNLADSVFCFPKDTAIEGQLLENSYSSKLLSKGWRVALSYMSQIEVVLSRYKRISTAITELDKRLLTLAAYLLPFRHLSCHDQKGKKVSVIEFIARESIKLKNKDVAGLMTLSDNVDSFVKLLERNSKPDRLDVGLLLRVTKDLWVTCLFLAAVSSHLVCEGQALYEGIVGMNLDASWKIQPLLNGRDLIHNLCLPKGPMIGIFLEEQMMWMLKHPSGTKEECLDYLISFKRKINAETKRRLSQGKEEESKRVHI